MQHADQASADRFAAALRLLALGVMSFPLADDGAIILVGEQPGTWDRSPQLEQGMALMSAAFREQGMPWPDDVLDWLRILSTPLVELPIPLPEELRVRESLLDSEGRPTPLAAKLAAQASPLGDEPTR